MKETILDVLLYLFENYFNEDSDLIRDRDSLQHSLIEAGFAPSEINRAFDWLEELSQQRPISRPIASPLGPVRVYCEPECERLEPEGIGFLMFLEQASVIDSDQRELILDRVMALDQESIDLEDLKWVILMVLFNQPGSEAAYAWMEIQMIEGEAERVH